MTNAQLEVVLNNSPGMNEEIQDSGATAAHVKREREAFIEKHLVKAGR